MDGLLILLGLATLFLAISLRIVPSDPPHVAVVTLFGKRLRRVRREGLRVFPFYPVVYNAILIDVTKKNQDLPIQSVRTRDYAELEASVSLTWTPSPDYAIEYLNNGGEAGTRNILSDMVRERLREWAIGRAWEDAVKAEDEAAALLVQKVCGLPPNPPSSQLMQLTTRLRMGDGVQTIPSLGITLNRLNIGEIALKGELARAAELLVKEERERVAERFELAHIVEVVSQIQQALHLSTEQALEIVQTERGKVAKRIAEFKGSVSDETVRLVEALLGDLEARRKPRKGNGSQS